jgi:predicted permease
MPVSNLFSTFSNNILPVMLISSVGWLLGKTLKIDTRSVGRVSFFFFNPILVFSLIIHSQLPLTEIFKTALLAIGVILGSGLIALAAGMVLKLERPVLISMLITAMFANNGNYGLPLISFAFGSNALAHSSIYFVFSALLINTLGVLVASLGHLDLKQAFWGMVRVPTFYAVLLAGLLGYLNITLPQPLERTISLAAGAGVPLMILLLGLELCNIRWTSHWQALGVGASIRLLIGPLLGLGLTALLGITGPGRQAGVMESAMPVAVANTNLAGEYNLDSALVAATILVSTLISPLTLTPLILFLGK